MNFRHLLHLGHDSSWPTGLGLQPGRYRMRSQLRDVLRLRDDRVILEIETRLLDEDQALRESHRDQFVILDLPPNEVAALDEFGTLNRSDVTELSTLSQERALIKAGQELRRQRIEVPDGMGLTYGKISGDLNMVHTTQLGARLFGFKRPFIQGLCTANYVLRELSTLTEGLAEFAIRFPRRIYNGSSIDVWIADGRFEVRKEDSDRLLAFGSWKPAS